VVTETSAIYSLCPSRALATLVQNALRLPVRRMEYRTSTEGGETVYVFEIPRMPRDSMFDALIQLMSIELHWYEEWDPRRQRPTLLRTLSSTGSFRRWSAASSANRLSMKSGARSLHAWRPRSGFSSVPHDHPRRGSTSTMSASRMMFGKRLPNTP
jgi:hypothetical protein